MEVAAWLGLFFLWPAPVKKDKNGKPVLPVVSKKKILGVERAIDLPQEQIPKIEKAMAEMERGIDDCEHCWFDSCFQGAKLHYRKFLPKGPVKGIVIWFHGIAAHSGRSLVLDEEGGKEKKFGMALQKERWLKAGYALYALDYLGHGYSEGIRFYVPGFETNRDDNIAFTKHVASLHPEGTPLFLTGESYGGCLTLHVAKHFQDNPADTPKGFNSILLLGAAVIPADLPPKPVVSLLLQLSLYYPTWIPFFMPNPVSADLVWRDKRVLDVFDSKERRAFGIDGGGRPFRLATASGMLEALQQVREDIIPTLTVPFCVLHGVKDYAVPISSMEFLLEHAATPEADRESKRFPEAYHDLLNDPVADETMDIMINFVEKRVAAA
ncbi:Monoglyceride lipase [Seminavis robusta]|uniref:Monoglyceride lipase n=1 Tax=Seminavis robusta TaxID=568900 RepID=A0A9N8D699_9STRA|nr:Monoglyceride lipase [Seminavis robusta]|eukprot:Sro11_g008600.1 Monoglyceride lipase (381) ;mRNA; r:94157-95299